MKNWQLYSITFVIGALAGTFYDSIHAYFDVLYYTSPHFWKLSLLVPVEFGVGAVLFLLNLKLIPKITDKLPSVKRRSIALSAVLLFVSYCITGLFAGDNYHTLMLILPFAILTLLTHKNKFQILLIASLTITGPLMEIAISSTGFFYYYYGDPIIPVWLPVLWTIAAGLFLDFGVFVIRKFQNHIQE